MSNNDIASLITMAAGEPQLAPGQHPVMPAKNDNVMPTADQIIANVGGTPQVSAPAQTPAQQANNQMLTTLAAGPTLPSQSLPPLQNGPAGLTVSDSGTGRQPAAATFTTSAAPPQAPAQQAAALPQSVQMQPVQMAPAAPAQAHHQPTAQVAHVADTSFDAEFDASEDGDDGAYDLDESEYFPVASAPPPPVPALPAPVAVPPAPTPIAPPAPVQRQQQAPTPVKAFVGDDELIHIQQIQAHITNQIATAMYNSGMTLLSDPKARPEGSYIHEVISRLKWTPQTIINLGPQELLSMEHVLTAHQVWIASQENYWSARHRMISADMDRLIFIKRDNYTSSTKTESENKLLAAEPQVRQMRNEYLLAQAMSTLYSEMGARFAQMEDGLKRTITFAVNEYERSKIQAKYQ